MNQYSKLKLNLVLEPLYFIVFLIKQIFLIMTLLTSISKLLHSILIVYITFLLYQINKTLPPLFVGIQIVMTLFITLIDKKKHGWYEKQIFFSLSLVYALRNTELNVLRFLFLAKILYVQRSLAEVSQHLFVGGSKFFRLLKVSFDFSRFTVVFYLFLGCLIVIYKYYASLWADSEKVISTHQILYFFMVTSSSIGFGDITPKNEYQKYFLIVFIPLLIVAFGQYCGHAVNCFTEFIAIMKENPASNVKAALLNEGIWGQQECTNIVDYIFHAQSKNASIHEDKLLFANNWLSLACKNYEVHQPLLMQILDQEDSKEYKLMVASKLKRQFYPKNWKILQKGNIDRKIFMIQDGQVEVNGQSLSAGATFNFAGFSQSEPSLETFLTKSFTSVWTISQQDLLEIGRNSINLKNKISKRVSTIFE